VIVNRIDYKVGVVLSVFIKKFKEKGEGVLSKVISK
jgi:hypothetical protein